jgi:antirestriction protein
VKRIFLVLATFSTLLLLASLVLGFEIGDVHSATPAARKLLSYHVLISIAALIVAALVHSVLYLTYFMGTSRWMEEARQAYKFDSRFSEENRRLKYRTIPLMVVCLLLLISNIPLGALSVDRADWTVRGLGAISPAHVHLVFSILTVIINLAVNAMEYWAIRRNGELIADVVDEVRRIREARGLPV